MTELHAFGVSSSTSILVRCSPMKTGNRFSITFFVAFIALSLAPFVMGQGDARRKTVAMTYLKDPVGVPMAGTTIRPNARGEATVERWRKRNESEIDVKVENLIPAFNYGADYTTYVLWAITPEGQVDNLGEFRLKNGEGRLKAATPYQTFALIVTAEPHYLVKLPSKKVVLENRAPSSRNVQIKASEIYFSGDSGKYYTDSSPPEIASRDYEKIPPELIQGRRAVQIARMADSERFDPNDYHEAVQSLNEAEASYRRGAPAYDVGRVARDAISKAVRALSISEEKALAADRRAEINRRDEEVRRATESATDLQSRLSDTESRLKASEIARVNAEEQHNISLREAADARAENRRLKSEVNQLQDDNERMSKSLSDARAQVTSLQSQLSSTSSQLNATSSRLNEASSKAEEMERKERERRELEARRRDFATLQSALSALLPVKASGDGFTATLPDAFFVLNKKDLALKIKSKIDAVATTIAAHPNVSFSIVGHSDARAGADAFALGRAQSTADYISALGVPRDSLRVDSRADSVPLASNKTLKGRAMNRRVELIFSSPR